MWLNMAVMGVPIVKGVGVNTLLDGGPRVVVAWSAGGIVDCGFRSGFCDATLPLVTRARNGHQFHISVPWL